MRSLIFRIVISAWLAAAALSAASIDGNWIFETKNQNKKSGAETTAKVTLALKSEGAALTGAVTTGGRRRNTTAEIKDGKIDGNRISFVTVTQKRKGEQKFTWTATLEGDELRGTRTREGARRGIEFTARRPN